MASPVEPSNSDYYDMFFEWPATEPFEVVVTGTFDNWARTKHLNKTARGFVGTVRVPWGEKIKYKFIVDGQWMTLKGEPTERDPGGYINNVFTTPSKPYVQESASPVVPGPEETPVQEETDKPAAAVVPASEEAVVLPPEAVTTTVPRIPVVLVPLNSTEHNTVGQTPIPSVPDYVLPPPPRSLSPTKAPATVALPVDPQPFEVTPVAVEVPETTNSENRAEEPAEEAKDEVPEPQAPAEIPVVESEAPKEAPEINAETAAAKEEDSQLESKPIIPEVPTPTNPDTEKAVEKSEAPPAVVEDDKTTSSPAQAVADPPAPAVEQPKEKVEPANGAVPAPQPLPTPPATPAKKGFPAHNRSPSSSFTISAPNSPSGKSTTSTRKKRHSIFGKLKKIFHHHDKDEEKEKEKINGSH